MKKIMICLAVLGISSGMAAQEPLPVYSLRQCLETGLENNYSVRLVKIEEEISERNATKGNAGMLPTVDLTGNYGGDFGSSRTEARSTGEITREKGAYDQSVNLGIDASWTIFDGFNLVTDYKQLQLLKRQGELNTRIAMEDFIASLVAEYYNFIQQKIRLKNFHYTMRLSKERVRLVEARFNIGSFSGLDYQQAKVDFNADSAQYMKQQEALITSKIRLNELMANKNVDQWFELEDSVIDLNMNLNYEDLWQATLQTNTSLLKASQNTQLSEMDLKKAMSRNYPYVKLNAGYGYTFNKYGLSSTRMRDNWGLNAGITVGFNLFDGSKRTKQQTARLALEGRKLEEEQLELSLKSDMNTLWQAYQNNLRMLQLERENVIVAKDNYEIAHYRYMKGELSGFEVREAQKSLRDAEERLLTVEYDTKTCEISLLLLSGHIITYL